MRSHPHKSNNRIRQAIANEAARIMVQEQQPNLGIAKRKAASRLGVTSETNLPSNMEVEKALSDYQSLFYPQKQQTYILHLLRQAHDAMCFFKSFKPFLVGRIISGTALPDAPITLHLFVETVETIMQFLMEHAIPYQETEQKIKYSKESSKVTPCYEITFAEQEFRLMIFSLVERRQAPLSTIDGKPMRRMDLKSVANMIQCNSAESDY